MSCWLYLVHFAAHADTETHTRADPGSVSLLAETPYFSVKTIPKMKTPYVYIFESLLFMILPVTLEKSLHAMSCQCEEGTVPFFRVQ